MSIADFLAGVRKNRLRVAVIGDAMIDTYLYGKVSRISPEFPVPILHSFAFKPEYYPGGAANVCYQLKHFNADVKLLAFTDKEASVLLSDIGIDLERCVVLEQGAIPRKIRYYDNEFPLLRHDIESPNYGCEDLGAERGLIFNNFLAIKDSLDVLIMSNYNKGLFDQAIVEYILDHCRRNGIITVVDPKSNPTWWAGCSVFKPNAAEAKMMTGESEWHKQCSILKERLDCGAVIITQAGSGVVGLADDYFEHRPKATIKDVSSVIGAGDCFAAVLGIALKHLTCAEAVKYAFEAGAEYVKAKHNRPITPYELHRRIDPMHAKIVSLEDIVYLRNGVYSNQRWVFTNGCFDLLHSGHLATLQQAKQRGDKLVIGINSDISVKALKGESRPILPLGERKQLLAALEYVDFIVDFDEPTPYNLVEAIRPHVMVKGGDYVPEAIAGSDLVEEVFIAEIVPGNSTTNIIEKIKSKYK